MVKLTLKNTIKSAKYGNKTIGELVESKGVIFSMIKDGYEFDDEVLEAAHIHKSISNVRTYCRVGGDCRDKMENLQKETKSIMQILSEINTIDNYGKDEYNSEDDNWSDGANNYDIGEDDE